MTDLSDGGVPAESHPRWAPIRQPLDGLYSCLPADRLWAACLKAGHQMLIKSAFPCRKHERSPLAPELLGEVWGDVGPDIDQQSPVEVSEQLRIVAVFEQPGIRTDTAIPIHGAAALPVTVGDDLRRLLREQGRLFARGSESEKAPDGVSSSTSAPPRLTRPRTVPAPRALPARKRGQGGARG